MVRIQRPPAQLWRAPAFLPHVQPALTATAVRDAERYLGVTLPSAYGQPREAHLHRVEPSRRWRRPPVR